MHSALVLLVTCAVAVSSDDHTILLQAQLSADPEYDSVDDLSYLLAQPGGVIDEMTSKVSDLEKRMTEMKQSHELKMTSQSQMFKKKLLEMSSNTTSIASENAIIRVGNKRLTAGNADKRQLAKNLTSKNAILLENLQHAQKMLETATEFVNKSMASNADIAQADLKVLTELNESDAEAEALAKHQAKLDEIVSAGDGLEDHKTLGMLDISPAKGGGTDNLAGDLVNGLEAGLDMFDKEAKQAEEQLKVRFLERFKNESVRQGTLMKAQAALVAQRKELKALQGRLAAAVSHLEATHASLEERIQSVQGFSIHNLGDIKATENKSM